MTLKRFNLDETHGWEGGSLLLHGPLGCGKTRLEGDFLLYEKQFGDVLFIDTPGEERNDIIRGLGLGNCAVLPQTFDEFNELLNELEAHPIRAVALDSLREWYRMCEIKRTGNEYKLPEGGSTKDNEYTAIHRWSHSSMTRLRRCAKYVMVVCPSDLGQDLIRKEDGSLTKTFIVPDLPGKMATNCATWFNFIGYFNTILKPGGKYYREIDFVTGGKHLARQSCPRPITEPIEIPGSGPGGWEKLKKEIEEHYTPVKKEGGK